MAGWSTQQAYTIFRPLVMDFPHDRSARELTSEFMFGPAMLVAPITQYKQRARPVYLPTASAWYDFWTGLLSATGKISASAPFDQIPVFVRAGSIVPFGPQIQYIAEKPSDPTTLYVYAGADGQFTLYEDQGTTFDYEKGAFSQIPFHWDDKASTLTIGARTGAYNGMLNHRTFQVVLVSKEHPAGFSFTPRPLRNVQYIGAEVRIKLQ